MGTDGDAGAGTSRRGPRRRWGRWVALGAVVALVAWTALAALQVDAARRRAQDGLDRLRTAQENLGPAELIRGEGLTDMRAAQADFRAAADAADSSWLTPFQVLPVVGRQVRSVRALTGGASTVVDVGVDAMERSTRELDQQVDPGPGRVELADRLGRIGHDASVRLADVGLGPGEALVGPLADARAKFARQLRKARTAMRNVDEAASGLATMARGPSRYLLLASNQAEMRTGSGMFLSAGVLTMQDGKFDLGPMTSVTDLMVFPGLVEPTGDYAARWGWLDPGQDWRYLAMSPQFDQSAELAVRMWKARTGEDVDGVLALDPIALRALVKVTGPVEVAGKRIDEGNVVRELLLQQYLEIPDDVYTGSRNDARRERNGEIARAIVDRLDQVGWDVADLVEDLRSAARGRHVLFWSSDPAQQRGWRAAGVAGAMPRDGFMVSLDNRGGNKLDQFVAVDVKLEHRRVAAGTRVTGTINVANLTPPTGLTRYVQGPYPGSDRAPGEYQGILSVSIPTLSRAISLDGVSRLVAAGPDGVTRVVAGDMRLPRGQAATFTVTFTVPTGAEHLEVISSARTPAIRYHFGDAAWDDDGPRSLRW